MSTAPPTGVVTFAGLLTLVLGIVAIIASVYFCIPTLWGPMVNPLSLTPDLVLVVAAYFGESWFVVLALGLLILGLLGVLGGIHVLKRVGVILALLFAVFTMICGGLFLRDALVLADLRELLGNVYLARLIVGVCALLYGLFMVIALGSGIKEFIGRDPQATG
jgi:hypothetical protein